MIHYRPFSKSVYQHASRNTPGLNMLTGKYGENANTETHGSFSPINNPHHTHFLCSTVPLFTVGPMSVCKKG